jgi:hypothetical protein
VTADWWQLADALMVKFGDGIDGSSYPDWWLSSSDVGYLNGPPSSEWQVKATQAESSAAEGKIRKHAKKMKKFGTRKM